MSQNGKLMPNLDQNSTKLLNLTVLQRIDPFVEEILITAAHVTFYEFNIDNNQWSRKDVEGSLFVVKRNTQPRFQFIVMNRRNTDNLVENLLEDFEFEIQVPYLLYRNAAQEVNGIWFYNSRECEEVANLFTRLLNAYSKVPTKSKVSPSKSEFEELEAVPTMAVMDGPLEPSVTTSNVAEVPDDPSFVNFFSTALNIGSASNSTMGGQPYGSSTMIQASHPQGVVPPMMQPSHPQGVLPPMMQPSHTQGVLPPMMQPSHTQGVLPPMMQPSHPQGVVPPTIEKIQASPAPLSTSTPLMPQNNEVNNDIKPSTNLVKPSTLFTPPSSLPLMMPPISSSVPTAPPLNPPGNLQRPYGAPLLQPFPPPNPPLSLTPTTAPTPNLAFITREKIREALLVLVQDDQFIDMVYRAVMNTHSS